MTFFSPFETYQVVLAVVLAGAWGLACSVFERIIILAPNRGLSAVGPAYVPAMLLALLAGAVFATTEGRSFLFAVLMAALFFGLGSLPALATFHFTRRVLRARPRND
jgi:hypothetical protein